MNDALKSYIEQYTECETGIRELISMKGGSLCAQCTRCCCDIVHCKEAITSPFLKQVHKQAEQFNEQNGFLSPTGCALEKGRPPVCYEYFCDDHFYYQPDELHAEILKILGTLLNHATRNARGNTPLEEIIQEEEIDLVDYELLKNQINESLQALEIIRTFYREGTLSETSLQKLRKIHTEENLQDTKNTKS
jgi:hypothetical protein